MYWNLPLRILWSKQWLADCTWIIASTKYALHRIFIFFFLFFFFLKLSVFIHTTHCLFRYLIGCNNILAKLHTKHPELCDKVGGLLAMHIDDLRALAPLWLSKTEEVREDRAHWATNITGDIYASGWISEMYGYSFGAAEVSQLICFLQPITFFRNLFAFLLSSWLFNSFLSFFRLDFGIRSMMT